MMAEEIRRIVHIRQNITTIILIIYRGWPVLEQALT